MLGFCVATCERAQLISRCRHFRVQAAPRALDTIEWPWQEKLFSFSPTPFFFLTLCLYIFHLPAPNKVFITRALRSSPAEMVLVPFHWQLSSGSRVSTCCGGKTMASGIFSFWFLSYFFCARILQIIGLVSRRVQCLLALFVCTL